MDYSDLTKSELHELYAQAESGMLGVDEDSLQEILENIQDELDRRAGL